jgi:hypothetical protein
MIEFEADKFAAAEAFPVEYGEKSRHCEAGYVMNWSNVLSGASVQLK